MKSEFLTFLFLLLHSFAPCEACPEGTRPSSFADALRAVGKAPTRYWYKRTLYPSDTLREELHFYYKFYNLIVR